MDKVDAHVHVFDRLSEAFPREVSSLVPAERQAKAELLLREMDTTGIDRAVLIGMGGTAIQDHRYVTQCVRRWPDRFSSTGLVKVNAPDPPAKLRALYEATGIEGIRLAGELGDPAAERPEELVVYGLFQCADELGLNVNLYCQSTQVPHIAMLARAFPGVNISLDHLGICPSTAFVVDRWGRPRFEDEPIPPATYHQVVDLAAYPNVYVKVSGEYAFSKKPYPYADMRPMVKQIYQAFGPTRMMWCTDFPMIARVPGYRRLVELIDHHLPAISSEDRDAITGGNALRVWFQR